MTRVSETEHAFDQVAAGVDGAVGRWNELRAAQEHRQVRIERDELVGLTAPGIDLTGVELVTSSLDNCTLRGAIFHDFTLPHTTARNGSLSNSSFRGARIACCFTDADLDDCNIVQCAFSGSSLGEAHIERTRITDSDFRGVCFDGCICKEAFFERVDLRGATFLGESYAGAPYYKAVLIGAVFFHCKLDGVDFAGATFGDTLVASDISLATRLELAEHVGRSFLDLPHLLEHRGHLPDSFLRGCGLSDVAINYVRSLATTPIDYYSCFISYSKSDALFARRLHDALQGKGIRCWLDEHQLLPGDELYDAIDRGIRLWDKVIVCCSDASLKSWWVDKELNAVLAKERRLQAERGMHVSAVIPVNLDGSLFTWTGGKSELLRSRFAVDCTEWEHNARQFEASIEAIARALATKDAGREAPPQPRL